MSSRVFILTGLPGTGKTTLAKLLATYLELHGYRVIILDGDEIRQLLYPDLGFSKEEREFHNKVMIYLAKYLSEILGYTVIISAIFPLKRVREFALKTLKNAVEIRLKAPLHILKSRKPEVYSNKSADFYEDSPAELIIDTSGNIEDSFRELILWLRQLGYIE